MFEKTVKFDSHHDYLAKLNEFRKEIYPKIQEQRDNQRGKRLTKLNEDREPPIPVEPDDVIFRKENRNKLTPRFSIHNVRTDKEVTLLTTRQQKLQKQKIRKIIRRNNNTQ